MLVFANDAARLKSFGHAIDQIKRDVDARVGDDDIRRIRKLRWLSRTCEVIGRGAIHFSFEPIAFTLGVFALFLHKQLEASEIGHTVLHGVYDRFGDKTGFHSQTFRWKVPVDEASWRYAHNVRHHGNTNVAGKDPDIHFGPLRLTEHTPWQPSHRVQLAFSLFFLLPNFTFLINPHVTGVTDVWLGNGRGGTDFLPDRSFASKLAAHKNAFRKYVPHYAYEYVLFPVLAAVAGSLWWKVLLGNWLSGLLRDIYTGASIFCGHVGHDVAAYPEGDRANGRGAWYARQAEASNNFEVAKPLSVLCGGLDFQIEHHLFPKLAPARLREVAPAVKRACEEHGVRYKSASWPTTLKKAFEYIATLSENASNDTSTSLAANVSETDAAAKLEFERERNLANSSTTA